MLVILSSQHLVNVFDSMWCLLQAGRRCRSRGTEKERSACPATPSLWHTVHVWGSRVPAEEAHWKKGDCLVCFVWIWDMWTGL